MVVEGVVLDSLDAHAKLSAILLEKSIKELEEANRKVEEWKEKERKIKELDEVVFKGFLSKFSNWLKNI